MSGSAKGVTAAKMKNRKYIWRLRPHFRPGQGQRRLQEAYHYVEDPRERQHPRLEQTGPLPAGPQCSRHRCQDLWRQPVHPPELLDRRLRWPAGSRTSHPSVCVENPSSATIVCQGDTFTLKLDQALADNGGIFLVIEATEGQSNGVSRAYSKASGIKLVEEPTDAAIDIHADYVSKNGAPTHSPRRSSSATTTSTAPPVRSLASCWQKPPGLLLPQVANPSPSSPDSSGLT